MVEAKSEVVEGRVEISKYKSEQMNSSAAWFQRNYPGSSSRNILVHPAKTLNDNALARVLWRR